METKSGIKMLVLPQDRSCNARIGTIAHPRTNIPSRYLFDPNGRIYEFIQVAAPKATRKSWLITSNQGEKQVRDLKVDGCKEINHEDLGQEAEQEEVTKGHVTKPAEGYIISKSEVLIATPIDALFFLIPILYDELSTKLASKQLFLTSEDLFDKISEKSKHFKQMIKYEPLRKAFETRLQAICDSVDAGDEKMYRVNENKLLAELVLKANKIVNFGLPASMEDKFVRRTLDIPIAGFTCEDSALIGSQPSPSGTPVSDATSVDSQRSTITSTSLASAESCATDLTTPNDMANSVELELLRLLRLRTILTYFLMSYIPKAVATKLNALLASEKSPVDFKALDERLEHIEKLRAEALAARSLGNFSRKRSTYEDDDAAEAKAEKKRKKEGEDRKKKLETRGVRELKKVDLTGMKKMSDFFGRGAVNNKK